ncbi:uncharacterized protein KD926_006439 [Aspergillus affinis]|uniref:uncharacterized protein n=1 Tax=Aspergillus affinis TaxID=1070780 RepID=UPI0022FDB996|nr:uncharacterized protein KD926_006439 [Aspergillus affinis]KAI9041893.1 hypothetical protein KD926_006439 [Aspergillus affinis]
MRVQPNKIAEPILTGFEPTAAEIIQENPYVFIDTNHGIADLIENLEGLPASPPSLYVDLEGVKLSRYGTVSVIQIYVLPLDMTYMIDVLKLQEETFSHPSSTDSTLKDIFESPSIPKVFFDVRSDSDALYSHFGINLAGVQDVQLMELATRRFSKELVHGLQKCIERDFSMSFSEKQAWKTRKENGRKLFAPGQGGSYEIWNKRPLPADIMHYCVQDVKILPRLWQRYRQMLSYRWSLLVDEEVEKRIIDSQSPDFIEKGRLRTLAPHGWKDIHFR